VGRRINLLQGQCRLGQRSSGPCGGVLYVLRQPMVLQPIAEVRNGPRLETRILSGACRSTLVAGRAWMRLNLQHRTPARHDGPGQRAEQRAVVSVSSRGVATRKYAFCRQARQLVEDLVGPGRRTR